jgi:predicted lipase
MKPKNMLYISRLCGAVYQSPKAIRRLFGKSLVKFFDKKEGHKIDTQVALFEPENMPNTLVVVFRGTQEPEDFLTDIDIRKQIIGHEVYDGELLDAEVHTGFNKAYEAISKDIAGWIHTKSKKKIIIAGHSLGGALATLCAYDISKNMPNKAITCVTFGSPRVGNNVFKEEFDRNIYESYRVVNGVDLVTKLPFKRWFWMNWCFAAGYRHVGKEVQVGDKPGMAFVKWFARIQRTLVEYHFMDKYIKSIQEEFESGELDFKL